MIQQKQQAADRDISFDKQVQKTLEEFMGGHYGRISYRGDDAWTPAMNLYSDDATHYIIMDISGMKLSEMNVEAGNGQLTICGCRPSPQPTCTKGSIRLEHMEIDSGKFCRSVKLPEDADADGITARYKNGQLIVTIPRNK